MKKILVAAFLALSLALPSVYAQSAAPIDPDSAAAVKELLIAMNFSDSMRKLLDQMFKSMPVIMLQGATQAINDNETLSDAQKSNAIAKVNREIPAAAAALASVFNDPALMDELGAQFVPLYSRHYTAAEIRQLAAFYQTAVGKKTIVLLPQIAGESMLIGQKVITPRVSAAIEKMLKVQ